MSIFLSALFLILGAVLGILGGIVGGFIGIINLFHNKK